MKSGAGSKRPRRLRTSDPGAELLADHRRNAEDGTGPSFTGYSGRGGDWGGIYGLVCSADFGETGAKVIVLEGETIGWGASSRNGGMVLTGMKLGVNELISMYGRERTQRMYAASLASIDCVEQIVLEENIDCDFCRCGHLKWPASRSISRLRAAG